MTLRAVKPFEPSHRDKALQSAMDAMIRLAKATSDREERKTIMAIYSELHSMRSAQVVASMEREKGLR